MNRAWEDYKNGKSIGKIQADFENGLYSNNIFNEDLNFLPTTDRIQWLVKGLAFLTDNEKSILKSHLNRTNVVNGPDAVNETGGA